ncbi:hypothetical protein CFC21_045578 [Triticum aestivum]|uniref:Uncharacterized protein n=2 Tax=Triticum aestivum TaxID=4565 RepID=A0A9R1JYU9_WHEAT|nr:uncharacterized protein LOC109738382 [Aegilops tauschii subsp. strangulata]XP_044352788.1 uncharacterized protein LOC123073830 [Triticum aestivum]KAF7034582.1 hypothetical protein CFC21_045578 [Triticum aestivum]
MAAGTLQIRPKAKSLWLLVRRLLCRGNKLHRPPAGAGDQQGDGCGEKRSLLGRSGSLEELLGPDVAGAVRRSARKDVQVVQHALLPPERQRQDHADAAEARPADEPLAASAAAVQQYRRFMFGGFRRRLMMRRQWRPMLVAIPE